jgi:antitoxin PrlF
MFVSAVRWAAVAGLAARQPGRRASVPWPKAVAVACIPHYGKEERKECMSEIRSRLTAKGQTTIPRAVRKALQLNEGDVLEFELESGAARIRKAAPEDLAYLRLLEGSLAEEWLSPEDAEAFDDL